METGEVGDVAKPKGGRRWGRDLGKEARPSHGPEGQRGSCSSHDSDCEAPGHGICQALHRGGAGLHMRYYFLESLREATKQENSEIAVDGQEN